MKRILSYAAVVFFSCGIALGQHFKVIHDFGGFPVDGSYTTSPVVFDQGGNLYGTSDGGGNSTAPACSAAPGCGVVYELSPQKDGSWTETVLYNFCSNYDGQTCADGEAPHAALVVDEAGNLYGTTVAGGSVPCPEANCGVVFELSPPTVPGSGWSETILYNFCSNNVGGQCLDGHSPGSQLIFDSLGNLYGTTAGGGSGHIDLGGGVVYMLSPSAHGWTESVLYNFCSLGDGDFCPDGFIPNGGVRFGPAGYLYGTTDYSGNSSGGSGGTVYQLSPGAGGWSYELLFGIPTNSKSNTLPGGISFDGAGNLYSTFAAPYGGVFRLNAKTHKPSSFSFNGTNGRSPQSGIYLSERAATIYGTTALSAGTGNVFEIGQNGKETVLHNFCSWKNCADGQLPYPAPVPDKFGNLYGTTEFGGKYGAGVVFEITP